MLGAVAAGTFSDLPTAMGEMSGAVREIMPRGGWIAAFHEAKYSVFRKMQDDYADYRSLMERAQVPEKENR
jgi:ribulose kinase